MRTDRCEESKNDRCFAKRSQKQIKLPMIMLGCGNADMLHRRRHRPGFPEWVKYSLEFILRDVSMGVGPFFFLVQWRHCSVRNSQWNSDTGYRFIVLCPAKHSVCGCSPVTRFS